MSKTERAAWLVATFLAAVLNAGTHDMEGWLLRGIVQGIALSVFLLCGAVSALKFRSGN
jgi:hypothetical protein